MFKNILKRMTAAVLTWEAKAVIRKYQPRIIAVTGSVGKTSTKDAIAAALSGTQSVRASEKSFNSDIGVPLTVLGLHNAWMNPLGWAVNFWKGLLLLVVKRAYPAWLVLEVGADRPGDIKSLASWLRPDVVVVTRFPEVPVHVEFFRDRQAVIEEKTHIVRALKEGGTLILNTDDPDVLALSSYARGPVVTFGAGERANFRIVDDTIVYEAGRPSGMRIRIDHGGSSVPVFVPGVLGAQYTYIVSAALAVASTLDQNLVEIAGVFERHALPPGRMRIIPGIKETTLIDDTYNASPVATEAALAVLARLETKGKKIAVLGDMLELGAHSIPAHRKVGKQVAEAADTLLAVGVRARDIAKGAEEAGMKKENIFLFDRSVHAGKELEHALHPGDVVLLKGSQSIRMEKAVEEVMAEPERAGELLVRQDEEWRKR